MTGFTTSVETPFDKNFIQLLINITNILSLWHGINFFALISRLGPIVDKIKNLWKCKSFRPRKYGLNIKFFGSYKVCFLKNLSIQFTNEMLI